MSEQKSHKRPSSPHSHGHAKSRPTYSRKPDSTDTTIVDKPNVSDTSKSEKPLSDRSKSEKPFIGTSSKLDQPIVKEWYPYCVVYDPIQAGSIDGTDTIPHDRAIVRALNSTYKPNTSLKSDPKHTLFVGRLNKNTREEDLSKAFDSFGKIESVTVIRDIVTGMSKKYAFVEFDNERSCIEAIRAMNKTDFLGSEIIVDFEAGRVLPGWKPRRLGGGWGGNKKSGQLRFGGRNRPWVKPVQLMNETELKLWRRQNGGER